MFKNIFSRLFLMVFLLIWLGLMVSYARADGYRRARIEFEETQQHLDDCFEREEGWQNLLKEARK